MENDFEIILTTGDIALMPGSHVLEWYIQMYKFCHTPYTESPVKFNRMVKTLEKLNNLNLFVVFC
jgi:hypothetical protein